MCVYVYVCTSICVYVYVCCAWAHVYVYACVYVDVYAYMCVCVPVQMLCSPVWGACVRLQHDSVFADLTGTLHFSSARIYPVPLLSIFRFLSGGVVGLFCCSVINDFGMPFFGSYQTFTECFPRFLAVCAPPPMKLPLSKVQILCSRTLRPVREVKCWWIQCRRHLPRTIWASRVLDFR